ncbi:MAG: glycosyltransferase family 2 protein [Gammaproteobacteria bacterium]|nr:glycosyltransferase family 2 protein [Gammaproteobacteria bacterium]
MTSRLLVVMVNWRAAKLATECIPSLASEIADLPGARAVIVDNDSQDGSERVLRDFVAAGGFSGVVEVVQAGRNAGFAAGNNVGIRHAFAKYGRFEFVALLNPDTMVRPGAYRILLEFMDGRPDVGIAGGRSEDPDATPQFCCFRFPSIANELAVNLRLGLVDKLLRDRIARVGIPTEAGPIDWVSGAHMMIRGRVLEEVGLMDESYFLYFEETDLTLRAKRAGWTCWHVPESRIVHLVGQSSGVTRREGPPQKVPTYWFESRRRFFVLNHGLAYALAADAVAVLGFALWRLRRRVQRKDDRDPPGFLRDLFRFSSLARGKRGVGPREVGW